jgi:endonuclease IV
MIGLHIKKTDHSTYNSAYSAYVRQFGIKAAQMFTHGPANSRCNNVDKVNCSHLYIHSAYLTMGIWSGKSKKLIASELREAERVDAHGLVIHIKDLDSDQILKICKDLHSEYNFAVPILLETPCLKSNRKNNYSHVNNLVKLLPLIHYNYYFCVDTSHLWASGVDVSDAASMNSWLTAMSSSIKLIHLNANLSDNFGRGLDIHIIPFSEADGMWFPKYGRSIETILPLLQKKQINLKEAWDTLSAANKKLLQESGFAAIVKFAKKNTIDCIGEVNRGSDIETMIFINLFLLLFTYGT